MPTSYKTKSHISILKEMKIGKIKKLADKKKIWEFQNEAFKKLVNSGQWFYPSQNKYNDYHNEYSIANPLKESITENPKNAYLLCIDEGVQDLASKTDSLAISIPGSGILMEKNDYIDFLQTLEDLSNQLNIEQLIVTSHEECGAGYLYTRNHFQFDGLVNKEDLQKCLINSVTDNFSRIEAMDLKTKIKNIHVKFAHIDKLNRPEFHTSRGVIVNFDSKINVGVLIHKLNLPMFDISAFVLKDKDISSSLDISHSIALGQHGFGSLFDEANPFLVLGLVNNEVQANLIKQFCSKFDQKNLAYSIAVV